MPEGALGPGTLANAKLQQDALPGVLAKSMAAGCDKPTDLSPYVMRAPSGEPGARVWAEQWVIACANQRTTPVTIEFKEDGLSAAHWTIRN